MVADNVNCTYIVAGDEMAQLMKATHPFRKIIPFCEDLSKGSYNRFSVDADFINDRSSFWGVSEGEYTEKLSPIINIDLSGEIVLCFGEDECCRANLEFVVGYLRCKGYDKPLRVNIVDEYSLDVLKEYFVD